jgi:3-hydroxyacyl-[acyl-carrier-protein] dehydratase
MKDYKQLVEKLPYGPDFIFVSEILSCTEDAIKGQYTFPDRGVSTTMDAIYDSHFKQKAVVPGVILTECMAQIGLVCFGLALQADVQGVPVFSESHVLFSRSVSPGDTVVVLSRKQYFRFNKLKCHVTMYSSEGDKIAEGDIAGMIAS